MNKNTFQTLRTIIVIIVAAVVSWSVVAKASVLIPLAIIIISMLLLFLLRRQVKEILEDERSHLINEKAARLALGIYGPLAALGAVILAVLGDEILPEGLGAGAVLSYATCALMIIYSLVHIYYERNH
jgi:uncharacterized membrane protein